jgi:hypothetical protein
VTDRIGLERCREELAAARLLADKGFEAQASSRACLARNEADYSPVEVPLEEAEAAIRDADRVVRAVGVWLERRGSP